MRQDVSFVDMDTVAYGNDAETIAKGYFLSLHAWNKKSKRLVGENWPLHHGRYAQLKNESAIQAKTNRYRRLKGAWKGVLPLYTPSPCRASKKMAHGCWPMVSDHVAESSRMSQSGPNPHFFNFNFQFHIS